jgi:hypothetical protein
MSFSTRLTVACFVAALLPHVAAIPISGQTVANGKAAGSVNDPREMYMISWRRELDNEDDLADDESIWLIRTKDGRNPNSPEKRSLDQLLKHVHGQRVLLVVHGFRMKDEALVELHCHIAHYQEKILANQYDRVIGLLWPGGNTLFDFRAALMNAEKTAELCAPTLVRVSRVAGSLDLVTYSAGARLALEALKQSTSPTVRHVWLLAPAVPDNCLNRGGKFHSAVSERLSGRVIVFHSHRDFALRRAYGVSQTRGALGYEGPHGFYEPGAGKRTVPKNVYVVNCRDVVADHGDYKGTREVYQFMERLLSGKDVPQTSRLKRQAKNE